MAAAPSKPGIISRAKLAAQVFREGLPWEKFARNQRASQEAKANPLTWPAYQIGRPDWQYIDTRSYVLEGFNQNSLIYSAIRYKFTSILASPLRAYHGNPERPELLSPSHPLTRLLARPNPGQSGPEFYQLATVYLNIAGECFIHMDRPKRGTLPTAMRTLRPDRVRIIPGIGGIEGYVYIPEGKSINDGIPLLPEDTMHVKFPNPGDLWEGLGRGLSPVSSMAASGDVDNDITRYLKLFFQRGGMPPHVLSFDTELDDADIARIRTRWQEIYGGWQNWATEIGVLDKTGKVQSVGMNFEEMGFKAIDNRNETRILMPFGVPPILIGAVTGLDASTYSNYEQARKAYWQDTMIPELQLFEVEYQYYLAGDSGEGDAFPAYDLSHVPALQSDINKLTEGAKRLWEMGVPANQAFAIVGIDTEPVDGGDIGFVPLSVTPVEQAMKPPESVPAQLALPAPRTGSQDDVDTEGAVNADEVEANKDKPVGQKFLAPPGSLMRRRAVLVPKVTASSRKVGKPN